MPVKDESIKSVMDAEREITELLDFHGLLQLLLPRLLSLTLLNWGNFIWKHQRL